MDEIWRWSNLGVAFGMELAGLGIFAWWGWRTGDHLALRVMLAIGLPVIAAIVWGLFAAPTADYGSPVVTTIVKIAQLITVARPPLKKLPIVPTNMSRKCMIREIPSCRLPSA